MVKGKVPVTEGQFLETVSKWIWLATNEGEPCYTCGFCDAMYEDAVLTCGSCQVYHLCGKANSPYGKWNYADVIDDEVGKKQAALEMLEGLYEVGIKLGFCKRETCDEVCED